MFTFAYAGILLFGQRHQDFSELGDAVLYMWNMLLGEYDAEMYMGEKLVPLSCIATDYYFVVQTHTFLALQTAQRTIHTRLHGSCSSTLSDSTS